jgi:predicted ribosomally synthesized peptide with nif11-like leader
VPDGVREAMRFLRDARRDATLAEAARAAVNLNGAVSLARAAGYDFGPDDLRRAHRVDWGLRASRYAEAPPGPSPS